MPTSHARTAAEIEAWFDDHGLPYFSGDHADRIERWLSRKRITAVIVLIAAVAITAGVCVGIFVDDGRAWGIFTGVA